MRHLSYIFRIFKDRTGIAATEFAITAPLMLLLSIGGFDLARYMLINQKAEKLAYTVSDVISQSNTNLTNAQVTQIMNASTQIMLPYPFGTAGVVIVTSVTQTGNYSASNPAKVSWQRTGGGSLSKPSLVGAPGLTATLPGGLTLNDKDNIIVAEVYYSYSPLFMNYILPSSTVYRTAVFKPRLGALSAAPS